MKIWPENNNRPSAVAYSQVQLVDASQQPVDLFIFNAKRGKSRMFDCWSSKSESWLEEGRPRELSSLPLATWSLLTTSVKEYQRGLRDMNLRIMRRIMIPTYIIWFLVLIGSGTAYGNGNRGKGDLISVMGWIGCCVTLVASVFVLRYYTQKHAQEVFHPSIQIVLQELGTPLSSAGFDVRLMVEEDKIGGKPVVSFLRFTPLRDDDKAAEAMAVATSCV